MASTILARNDTEGLKLWDAANTEWARVWPEQGPAGIQGNWQRNAGVYAHCLAESDPATAYVACNTAQSKGAIFKTTNLGVTGTTWTDVTPAGYGPQGVIPLDGNDEPREARRAHCHRSDPDIAIICDETKAWRTTNGTTFTEITSLVGGAITSVNGLKASFVGLTSNPDNHNEWYIGNPSANQFYKSTDAGATWTGIGLGPVMGSNRTYFVRLRSQAWFSGQRIVFSNKSNNNGGFDVYDVATNSWSAMAIGGSGGGFTDGIVTVNPANRDEAIFSRANHTFYGMTENGGTTWITNGIFDNIPACVSSTGISWHTHAGGAINNNKHLGYRSNAAVVDANGEIWFMGGNNGVAHANFSALLQAAKNKTQFTLTTEGQGTENICPAVILAPSGAPRDRGLFVGFWDEGRGSCDRDGLVFPHVLTRFIDNGPPSATQLTGVWGADFAKDAQNVVVAVPSQITHFAQSYLGGISTDYGVTFTQFATPPWSGVGQDYCGMTAILACSTADNFMILAGQDQGLRYTKDGGQTWLNATIGGLDYGTPGASQLVDTHWSAIFHRNYLAADPVTANRFYFMNMSKNHIAGRGIWRTDDGGDTWTQRCTPATVGQTTYDACLYHSGIKIPPGQGDHLWMYCGQLGNEPDNADSGIPLVFSTNGGTSWTTMAGATEPVQIAFGKEAPGETYPTLYMCGYVNGVPGYWANPDPLNNSAADWVKLGDTNPLDRSDVPISAAADPDVHGICYFGCGCTGVRTGHWAATIAAG